MASTAPPAIEVTNLRKYFRIPAPEARSLLNRLSHPVQQRRPRTLRVLDGVSFEVQPGEMFGVVGRNGSGKSTLLRVLANIYRPDSGRVRVTGNVGPFIELGVGFDPQLSARQNVVLNGVMLGLTRREMHRRVDGIIDYAELAEFADVQLKNLSSGMRVRLAFASMMQVDPEIYLIDEILAVGDEAFQEKCLETFTELRQKGRAIVMVSHRRPVIEKQCDRAMLIENGRVAVMGTPDAVMERYRPDRGASNRSGRAAGGGARPQNGGLPENGGRTEPREPRTVRATVTEMSLEADGDRDVPLLQAGESIRLRVAAETSGWVKEPALELTIESADGTTVFCSRDGDPAGVPILKPGEGLVADVTIENSLSSGHYRLGCAVVHSPGRRAAPVSATVFRDFEVAGADSLGGLVGLNHAVALERRPERGGVL